MSRIIFIFFGLTIGGCAYTCRESIYTIDTDNINEYFAYCDYGAVVSYEETQRGMVLLCTCISK